MKILKNYMVSHMITSACIGFSKKKSFGFLQQNLNIQWGQCDDFFVMDPMIIKNVNYCEDVPIR